MIVLIDGYNLLKKLHGVSVSEMQVRAFVNLLGFYLKKRNHKMKVILDGGQSSFLIKERQKGIDIWYSGYNRSADEVIIEYAFDHKNKDLVVVTQDREICQKMTEYGIEVIDPFIFYQRVKDVCQGSEKPKAVDYENQIKKISDEKDEAIDALMKEAAGMKIPFKHDVEYKKQRIACDKLSKKEKSRQKALDKL